MDQLNQILRREGFDDEAKAQGSQRVVKPKRKRRRILFIQTGGTIDKDYPRKTMGTEETKKYTYEKQSSMITNFFNRFSTFIS